MPGSAETFFLSSSNFSLHPSSLGSSFFAPSLLSGHGGWVTSARRSLSQESTLAARAGPPITGQITNNCVTCRRPFRRLPAPTFLRRLLSWLRATSAPLQEKTYGCVSFVPMFKPFHPPPPYNNVLLDTSWPVASPVTPRSLKFALNVFFFLRNL